MTPAVKGRLKIKQQQCSYSKARHRYKKVFLLCTSTCEY